MPPAAPRPPTPPAPLIRAVRLTWAAPLTLAALLAMPGAAAAVENDPPGYRIHSETVLILDRWRGTRTVTVERTDLRQRLRLDAWRLGQGPESRSGPRLDLVLDLEVGSDLGPTAEVLEAVPDNRRVVLDLYAAHLRIDDAFGALDARVGRHRVIDALGVAALDGASVELRLLPHVTARVLGGLTVRRVWTGVGPDLYEADGTLLRDGPGGVFGIGLRSRDLGPHAVDLAWRRVVDDGGTLRDEIGAAGSMRVLDRLDATAGAVFDLVWLRPSELRIGLGWRATDATRLDAEWLRVHPTFAADSIWNAFVTEAHHAARIAAHHEAGPWLLAGDLELRVFDGGAGAEASDDLAFVGGARIDRGFTMLSRTARMGLDGRVGLGYGGTLHHLDAFGRLPLRMIGPNSPIWLKIRLGAVRFDVPDRDDWDGWAGWLAVAGEWFAAEGIRIDGVLEGHGHRAEALRLRALARLTVEDLW